MPHEDLSGRYPAELPWLKERYVAGTTLATACTGALILGEAGLLHGQDVTTHWGYCEALAARYPTAFRARGNASSWQAGEPHGSTWRSS